MLSVVSLRESAFLKDYFNLKSIDYLKYNVDDFLFVKFNRKTTTMCMGINQKEFRSQIHLNSNLDKTEKFFFSEIYNFRLKALAYLIDPINKCNILVLNKNNKEYIDFIILEDFPRNDEMDYNFAFDMFNIITFINICDTKHISGIIYRLPIPADINLDKLYRITDPNIMNEKGEAHDKDYIEKIKTIISSNDFDGFYLCDLKKEFDFESFLHSYFNFIKDGRHTILDDPMFD